MLYPASVSGSVLILLLYSPPFDGMQSHILAADYFGVELLQSLGEELEIVRSVLFADPVKLVLTLHGCPPHGMRGIRIAVIYLICKNIVLIFVRCPLIKVEFSPERVALSPIVRTTRSLDVSDSPAAAASSAAADPPGPAGATAAAEQGNSIRIINIDNIKGTPFGVPSDRSGDHTNWIVTDFRPPLRSSETL